MAQDLAAVKAYHALSKHDFQRYAPGPHGLEWANQPDPFLRYEGAPLLALERGFEGERVGLADALCGRAQVAPFDARSVARLFFDSLALSAWKEFRGSRWALRVNPSSGNLHPTEAYLVAGALPGLSNAPALYHYAPREHALELQGELEPARWSALARGETGAFLVLTSILWREAWKYGERAFRYCQHDLGHALASLAYAAAGLGWEVRSLEGSSTAEIAHLAGIEGSSGPEFEEAECLLWVGPRGAPVPPEPAREPLALKIRSLGRRRPLSLDPLHWREAERCARATQKPRTPALPPAPCAGRAGRAPSSGELRSLVRARRSAVALDGRTELEREVFYRILAATRPSSDRAPFCAWPHETRVALAVFVHRVRDLAPGLYLFEREAGEAARLRPLLRPDFLWELAPSAGDLGLHLLLPLDLRDAAAAISCHQDIAAEGAFSLGMLAEFDRALAEHGPWFYRRLFWECGMIGQVLYLEAQAAEVRGTGIGCYFDDPMHELLGLSGTPWQDLYHFTVGGAVEDERLTTLPAYSGLASS